MSETEDAETRRQAQDLQRILDAERRKGKYLMLQFNGRTHTIDKNEIAQNSLNTIDFMMLGFILIVTTYGSS